MIDLDNIPNELLSDTNLVAYEKVADQKENMLSSFAKDKSISVMIGPEGGFSEKEINLLKDQGFEIVSLGKRILRTETAAVYALSVIGFLLEK